MRLRKGYAIAAAVIAADRALKMLAFRLPEEDEWCTTGMLTTLTRT